MRGLVCARAPPSARPAAMHPGPCARAALRHPTCALRGTARAPRHSSGPLHGQLVRVWLVPSWLALKQSEMLASSFELRAAGRQSRQRCGHTELSWLGWGAHSEVRSAHGRHRHGKVRAWVLAVAALQILSSRATGHAQHVGLRLPDLRACRTPRPDPPGASDVSLCPKGPVEGVHELGVVHAGRQVIGLREGGRTEGANRADCRIEGRVGLLWPDACPRNTPHLATINSALAAKSPPCLTASSPEGSSGPAAAPGQGSPLQSEPGCTCRSPPTTPSSCSAGSSAPLRRRRRVKRRASSAGMRAAQHCVEQGRLGKRWAWTWCLAQFAFLS